MGCTCFLLDITKKCSVQSGGAVSIPDPHRIKPAISLACKIRSPLCSSQQNITVLMDGVVVWVGGWVGRGEGKRTYPAYNSAFHIW